MSDESDLTLRAEAAFATGGKKRDGFLMAGR
jgi:hypothetical protein